MPTKFPKLQLDQSIYVCKFEWFLLSMWKEAEILIIHILGKGKGFSQIWYVVSPAQRAPSL